MAMAGALRDAVAAQLGGAATDSFLADGLEAFLLGLPAADPQGQKQATEEQAASEVPSAVEFLGRDEHKVRARSRRGLRERERERGRVSIGKD